MSEKPFTPSDGFDWESSEDLTALPEPELEELLARVLEEERLAAYRRERRNSQIFEDVADRYQNANIDSFRLVALFMPGIKLAVQKVQEREGELRQALQDLFGIAPKIRCEMRNAVVDVTEPVEDEPLSEEEALAHLSAELGATPSSEDV